MINYPTHRHWLAFVTLLFTICIATLSISTLSVHARASHRAIAQPHAPVAIHALTVTTASGELDANDPTCSLPEAIFNANVNSNFYPECGSGAGAVTVTFAAPLAGAIITVSAELVISDDLALDGSAAPTITISGANSTRVINISRDEATVTLHHLIIRDGNTLDSGGGIANAGTLTLFATTVVSNTAAQGGGGIFNRGKLTLIDSQILNNSVNNMLYPFFNGGGIHNEGEIHIARTLIRGNFSLYSAGGLSNSRDATATIVDSTIQENTCDIGDNGGISNRGTLTLTTSLVISNETQSEIGGVHNAGNMWIIQSTITGNRSLSVGGIGNYGTLHLIQSTVSNNQGGYYEDEGEEDNAAIARVAADFTNCAGINTRGVLTVTNSTISGNYFQPNRFFTDFGGGLCQYGEASHTLVEYSTVVDNTAEPPSTTRSGIWVGGGTLTLHSSIVANNGNDNFAIDAEGQVVSLGYNLTDSTLVTVPFLNQATDLTTTEPLLGPLTNNGGPTATHLFPFLSPAMDNGDTNNCPAVDQRGRSRPRNLQCDIGAVEALEILYLPTTIRTD